MSALVNLNPMRACIWAVLCTGCLALAGCAPMQWHTDPMSHIPHSGEVEKPHPAPSRLWGASDESRQIERDLGVN